MDRRPIEVDGLVRVDRRGLRTSTRTVAGRANRWSAEGRATTLLTAGKMAKGLRNRDTNSAKDLLSEAGGAANQALFPVPLHDLRASGARFASLVRKPAGDGIGGRADLDELAAAGNRTSSSGRRPRLLEGSASQRRKAGIKSWPPRDRDWLGRGRSPPV